MVEQIISILTGFIINTISTLGYPGVAALMAVQTAAIPLPSEIVIPFAGYLAGTGRFTLAGVALAGALGSCAGSSFAYLAGYKGGRPMVEKYGKAFLISSRDLRQADKFFAKHGAEAVFLGMMLPIFRSFISIPAGIAGVRYWKFLLYVFMGSFAWSLALGYFGLLLGSNWQALHKSLYGLDFAAAALILLAGFWWVRRHVKHMALKEAAGKGK